MTAARDHESVFTLEATPIKFGPGAAADAGWELQRLGVRRALLVTDRGVAAMGHPDRVRRSIEAEGIEVVVYDGVHVEPTRDSLQEAADVARDARVDGFVSVGGGSSIDTAKVADLITTHPGAGHGLRQPAGGRRPQAPVAAAPAPRDPHHLRDRGGGHDRRGPRHPRAQGQDRDLASLPASRPGDRRPRVRAHAAGAGHVVHRAST